MRSALAIALLLFAGSAAGADTVKQTEKALRGSGVYGTAGCGLGSMVFGNQTGPVQILAAFLNGTGMQTFAISTGTSNCQPGAFAMGTKNFVEANRQVVAKDIARGQGETIAALSAINACKDPRAVGAALQHDFAAIFPSERATNDEVTAAILRTLYADAALGCGRG